MYPLRAGSILPVPALHQGVVLSKSRASGQSFCVAKGPKGKAGSLIQIWISYPLKPKALQFLLSICKHIPASIYVALCGKQFQPFIVLYKEFFIQRWDCRWFFPVTGPSHWFLPGSRWFGAWSCLPASMPGWLRSAPGTGWGCSTASGGNCGTSDDLQRAGGLVGRQGMFHDGWMVNWLTIYIYILYICYIYIYIIYIYYIYIVTICRYDSSRKLVVFDVAANVVSYIVFGFSRWLLVALAWWHLYSYMHEIQDLYSHRNCEQIPMVTW